MKKCPNCNSKNADTAKQCNFCDAELPEVQKTEIKEPVFIHDSEGEKKKAKSRKTTVFLASLLVVAILVSLIVFIFATDSTTPNEEFLEVLTSSLEEGKSYKGTITGKNGEYSFTLTFGKENAEFSITKQMTAALYTTQKYTFTKEKLTVTPSTGEPYHVTKDSKDAKEYNLFMAYLTLSKVSANEKNLLKYETEDIKTVFLPIIKENLVEDFDSVFIEDNFITSISSILKTFESTPDLQTYFGITLGEDVKNSDISFKLSSYDFQNHTLSQLKKAYKNQAEYDKVNNALKEAKSHVKNAYTAQGTIKTQNGAIVSANAEIVYDGYAYSISLTAE